MFATRYQINDPDMTYYSASNTNAVSECNYTVDTSDNGDTMTLNGTIYVTPDKEEMIYYANPVYQCVDGSVYAVPATGVALGSDLAEATSCSQTYDQTITVQENGKNKSKTSNIKISMLIMYAPKKIAVVQMDQDNTVLSHQEYEPEHIPDSIQTESKAAYIIVETYKTDLEENEIIARKIFDAANESVDSYYVNGNGICLRYDTDLLWN